MCSRERERENKSKKSGCEKELAKSQQLREVIRWFARARDARHEEGRNNASSYKRAVGRLKKNESGDARARVCFE